MREVEKHEEGLKKEKKKVEERMPKINDTMKCEKAD
jgi:hypothetical protein